MPNEQKQSEVPEQIAGKGGLEPGVARKVAAETGVPEAEIFGVGSFFHLLDDPNIKVRVCQGLSCLLQGSKELLTKAKAAGLPAEGCSCLAACDRPVAVLRERHVLPEVVEEDLDRAKADWKQLRTSTVPEGEVWMGQVGPANLSPDQSAFDLSGEPDYSAAAFKKVAASDPEAFLAELEASGLQGRGGAGFPSAFKWKAVRGQAEQTRYVVLNADEGEPGTFKDREILLRRPDRVLEGLAIGAQLVGASQVYLYLRGEFEDPWKVLEGAIKKFEAQKSFPGIHFHLHSGHGAYICGEETALLEGLEGKRGMPRLRPPYPTEAGLWGKPTLIHNVETIACVPKIAQRGGEWFQKLGRTGPGTMLYCVSGHVTQPGIYEMPLGVCLDEVVEAAGGYEGNLKAFSPGGASSGFLPASERKRPLDPKSLKEAGSMLGSRGVVVLNDSVNLAWAARAQLRFFEVESCGQCAPCRIGTRFLRETVDHIQDQNGSTAEPDRKKKLEHAAEVAWEMNEGSICGLGQAAPLPLTTALKYFPEDF